MTSPATPEAYDAILFVSFGGPEKPEDVLPFLENVTRGRGVPRERLREVAKNYDRLGGKSPLNEQNRNLIRALEPELARAGWKLPIYFGNRHWNPTLEEAIGKMASDGVERALAFITSAYSSYSGCRAYREDIERAREAVGPRAPSVEKLRAFWNHPGFVDPLSENVARALASIPAERRDRAVVAYTAHSIPLSMSESCDYLQQLLEVKGLVDGRLEPAVPSELVFQSRSGPPSQPWLEPDIVDHLENLHQTGITDVVVAPIGFLSDHVEVVFDLDTQAQEKALELGMHMVRADTVGTAPAFVQMIVELIGERLDPSREARCVGALGPRAVPCAPDCCPAPRRPARPEGASQRPG